MHWIDQLASAYKLKRVDFHTLRIVENMAHGDRTALQTDVVLSCIFSNLNTKDLLTCRLIAKTWERNAGTLLKAKPLFMSFSKRDKYESKPTPINEKALKVTLKLAEKSLKSNLNFPCLGLSMCGDYWKLKSFQDFVAAHGKYFKRLRIANVSHDVAIDLLLKHFRDVEYLHMRDSFKENDEPAAGTASEKDIEELKSLKIFTIPCSIKPEDTLTISFCEKVIQAAPNLRRIINFGCQLAATLNDCSKLHLIEEFNMNSQRAELKDLKYFAKTLPRLKTLDLCPYDYIGGSCFGNHDYYDIDLYCKALFDIMESSKDTLTKLITHVFHTVPVLPHVKFLRIEKDPLGLCEVPRLCRLMEVTQCFPALQQVCLNCTHCYDYEVKDYLEGFGPFPNVKILELEQPWEGNAFDYIKEPFPNVTHLKVKLGFDIFDLEEGMTFCTWDLWTVPWDLETLELKNVVVQDFDSLLTGIAIRKCKALRFQSKVYKRKGSYDYLRVRRNITNYPALKNLTMFFMDSFELKNQEKSYESLENLSPIGVWYGLNLMPCLAKVKFQYDFHGRHADRISKVLKPYAASVTIENRNARELY